MAIETLRQKQSRFVRYVGRLIQFATDSGYELTAGEFYRTPEQEAYNAAHGLGIAASLHTLRLAVDFNLFKDGVLCNHVADFEPLGIYWENLATDCAWGGRFHTRPDPYHFSLAHNGVK
jgi:hypothetical protein